MQIPTGEVAIWVLVLAYGGHVLEEFNYNWKDWAGQTFGFDTNWDHFYVVNSFVIVFGFSAGMIGWKLPDVSLMFPAFALTNAIFFHLLPAHYFSPLFAGAFHRYIPIRANFTLGLLECICRQRINNTQHTNILTRRRNNHGFASFVNKNEEL